MDTSVPRSPPPLRFTPEQGRGGVVPPGQSTAPMMRHGTMELRWHDPHGHDPQTPHDRDEMYVVAAGTAVFVRAEDGAAFAEEAVPALGGEERVAVRPGDALFVAAGVAHRFEAASADFGAWSIFYGPEGGEAE